MILLINACDHVIIVVLKRFVIWLSWSSLVGAKQKTKKWYWIFGFTSIFYV